MPAPIDPTPETSASPGYALLIGIDHYDNLDPSAELPGSRNDVLLWYRFCRNHLGIPVENIRMLTGPLLDPRADDFHRMRQGMVAGFGEAAELRQTFEIADGREDGGGALCGDVVEHGGGRRP